MSLKRYTPLRRTKRLNPVNKKRRAARFAEPEPFGYLDDEPIRVRVTYVLSGLGIEPGYVAIGIEVLP